ncbi:lytic transglycosylase domain-containing protein [Humibacter sp. RRB41]|uniref:aggregation-promoting factor C-terminal-like domain-containing protein n=1 Tax=Humibacter sp. RRB41 TaxID=2919946 RepID=UPI001FAA16FE|nr:lytic transglycosylase domain-containing protein [Humibacter sp. RRB41]
MEARVRRPRAARAARPVVVGVAFLAAIGFFLVNIVDPYSGAVASPDFASSHSRFLGQSVQKLAVSDASSDQKLIVDKYSSKAAPKPKPVVTAPTTTATSTDSSDTSSAPAAGTPDPGSAQAYAQGVLTSQGMGADQFNCLVALWNRESSWNIYAYNSSTGAYGIPQALPGSKMASSGADWATSFVTQVNWGLGYVDGRYGTPCGAWEHSESTGWY